MSSPFDRGWEKYMNASHHAPLLRSTFVAALALLNGALTPNMAAAAAIAPETKIRLKIMQWMPTKGEYIQWALGGDFVVSEGGTVTIPVIGAVTVGDLDEARLAAEIARRLQAKLGLMEAPEASIEVVEYPPVYVLGDVTKPGKYEFRPGLTALQALAMSGGELRQANPTQSQDRMKLIGDLKSVDLALLRSNARIARLQAEVSGVKEVHFPEPIGADASHVTEIQNQERIIFSTRANVLTRQSKSLDELRNLLDQEIRVLEEKVNGSDASIRAADQELKGVRSLVERGVAVASRQSDLERELAGYHASRLDFITAIMRARQEISGTTRSLEGLYDNRHAEVASELQAEQAALEQLKLKRVTTEKQLLDMLAADDNSPPPGEEASPSFKIIRRGDEKADEVRASGSTMLRPGDVIRIVRPARQDPAISAGPLSSPLSTSSQPDRVSQ